MHKALIKKYLGASLLSLSVAVLASSVSHAAFTGLERSTQTAVAALTGNGTVSMTPTIKKISDNTPDTAINWLGVTLPATFVDGSDYISLAFSITANGGGIEIYTDNTASDANPKYTGVISSVTQTPAGLVDTSTTTNKLPTAWSIKADTTTAPIAANPNNVNDPNSFQWLYHEDRAQVAVPSLGAAAFVDGDPYITVLNTNGIHFGQGPTQFGPAPSPVAIYSEADFTSAVTPRTYQTSTLRLEAFIQ